MLTWYTVGSGTPRGRRPGLLCSFGHFREVEDAAKEAKETLYSTDSTSWQPLRTLAWRPARMPTPLSWRPPRPERESNYCYHTVVAFPLLYSCPRKKLLFHGPFFNLKLSERGPKDRGSKAKIRFLKFSSFSFFDMKERTARRQMSLNFEIF